MTSKHTPGPWAMNPVAAQIDAMPSLIPVCQLLWPTRQRSESETEANARLIAAAPEMLEALIQAAAHLSSGIQTNQGSHEEPPEPASQWDYEAGLMAGDLLRLVAKATGEGA